MSGFRALLGKELLEQWRTTRLPVVTAVFVLVGLTSPLLARFTPEIIEAVGGGQIRIELPTPSAADAVDQFSKNLGQFGILVAVLLAMGSVATEKDRGTAGMILTKPAGRAAFLIAKGVALATTLGIATALAGAGAWFYTLILFEPLPIGGYAASVILQWLSLVAFAAITFLGSVLTRSAIAAAGLGVAAFIVVGLLGIVPDVARLLPTGLGAPARALALGRGGVDVAPVVATVALIAAVLAVSWVAFRRQEL